MEKDDVNQVLTKLHDGLVGRHFSGEIIAHKVLGAGYSWPTLFKDAHAYAQKYPIFQVNAGRERRHAHFN